ncbi:MAG TPA: hypothetical protein VJ964_13250 [Balneolaceae bacterium]|nr:hypothetical protein [Balneolaceae bacterium]
MGNPCKGPLNWSRSRAKAGSGFVAGDFLGYFFDRSKIVTEPEFVKEMACISLPFKGSTLVVFREGGVFSVPEKTPPDPIWSKNGPSWPTLFEEGLWGGGDQGVYHLISN